MQSLNILLYACANDFFYFCLAFILSFLLFCLYLPIPYTTMSLLGSLPIKRGNNNDTDDDEDDVKIKNI